MFSFKALSKLIGVALVFVAELSSFKVASAADACTADNMTLECIIKGVNTNIVNPFIFLLIAVALVIFIWGLVTFFQNLDNSEERAQGVRQMIWGVVGLVIMLSVKGIITIIKNFIGV